MNQRSKVVLIALTISGTVALGWQATPSFAESISQLASGGIISNQTSENALSIIPGRDVGKSRSSSGALFVDNTKNRNTGLTLYSNMSGAVEQPLVRLEVDNTGWDEEILYIHSDSPTSRGLIRLDSPAPEIEFVETDQSGATGKFEVRVQHGELQWNSRRPDDTTFEKKVTMTQSGDLELHGGAVVVESGKPSEFKGGINVTGGCIAVDGKCLSSSSAPAASAPAPAPAGGGVEVIEGAPRDLDCNSYTERGALRLDAENDRLYVCNGPERGWDYTTLSD